MLEIAKFTYNSKIYLTTTKVPIYLGYRVVPIIPNRIKPNSGKRGDKVYIPNLTRPVYKVPNAIKRVARLLSDRKEVTKYIIYT